MNINKIALSLGLVVVIWVMGMTVDIVVENPLSPTGWVSHTQNVRSMLSDVYTNVLEAQNNQAQYLLTSNTAFIDDYRTSKSRVSANIKILSNLLQDNANQQAKLLIVERLIYSKLSKMDHVIDAYNHGGREYAINVAKAIPGYYSRQISDVMNAMYGEENRLLDIRVRHAKRQSRELIGCMFGVLGVMIIWAYNEYRKHTISN